MTGFLRWICRNSFCLFYPEEKIKLETFLEDIWKKFPFKAAIVYTGLGLSAALLFFIKSHKLKFPSHLNANHLEKTFSRCFYSPSYFVRLLSYAIKSQASVALYRT